jgi:cytochrome P450
MSAAIKARRQNPGDDLISFIANAKRDTDGELFGDQELLEICRQVLGGGADTTTSLLANAFIYLSRHPEARQRLIDDPEITPYACEEFIRYFSPVHSSSRNVKKATKSAGTAINAGDKVLLAYASANRDEMQFDEPDVVKLDRYPNPHIGFGVGIHRCLGSHMARQSFNALLTEVLRRIPDLCVREDKAEQYATTGVINGWIRVPATFSPGVRENLDPDLAKLLRLRRQGS